MDSWGGAQYSSHRGLKRERFYRAGDPMPQDKGHDETSMHESYGSGGAKERVQAAQTGNILI
jgi:hypothetical protein